MAEAGGGAAVYVLPHDAALAPVRQCLFNATCRPTHLDIVWHNEKSRGNDERPPPHLVPANPGPMLAGHRVTMYSMPPVGVDRVTGVTM